LTKVGIDGTVTDAMALEPISGLALMRPHNNLGD
jgi:hypothetical protein